MRQVVCTTTMNHFEKLVEYFSKFPGIGKRQAKRFASFVIKHPNDAFIDDFVATLRKAREEKTVCTRCMRTFFSTHPADKNDGVCTICAPGTVSPREALMVVEKDVDMETVLGMNVFDGDFFVLGGTIPLVGKRGYDMLHIKELEKRVADDAPRGLKEVILAFSLTPEGEHTRLSIAKTLSPIAEKFGVRISTLGRGLSTGTELEYSDNETLANALKNRS